MKRQIELPDKTLQLSCGDKVEIFIRKDDVLFSFSCDGTGNSFKLSKDELFTMAQQMEKIQ